MILTFGKYKDYDTSDPKVPYSYLVWLSTQHWITEELAKDLVVEFRRRSEDRPGIGKDIGKKF